ncbi:type II toxin-antitoxin system VapB family antitoxin [Nocardioides sp.]|uniref:type II toxin-antitoxin system VapB family antitoxin n=1 Tax=Nocardioides sp. TaxID=35761 RepID=UPI0039E324CC
MVTTKLFLSNTTQAVRLPKAVAFPDDVTEVEITVEGDSRIIRPVRVDISWERFFKLREELGGVGDDFLADRDEGVRDQEERAWWWE